jgi:hypothetical protein
MAVMDEFKKERDEIKNAPLNKKLQYVWNYYWVQILIVVGLILTMAGVFFVVTNKKEPVLNGIYVNCQNEDYVNKELIKEFVEEQEIDLKKQEIYFVTNLAYRLDDGMTSGSTNKQTTQALTIYHESKTMDFVIAQKEIMVELALKNYFADLADILTEEQYKALEPYFISFPNSKGEQVPVLIDMSKSQILKEGFDEEAKDSLVFGVVTGAPHVEMVGEYIEYLMR